MPTIDIKELELKDQLYNRVRQKYKIEIDTLKDIFYDSQLMKWKDIPEGYINEFKED